MRDEHVQSRALTRKFMVPHLRLNNSVDDNYFNYNQLGFFLLFQAFDLSTEQVKPIVFTACVK